MTEFVDNLPGPNWIKLFQSCHNLTRTSDNVKPSRAKIFLDQINCYFNNLLNLTQGIDPQNACNYDETNVTDKPGAKMCIV